MALALVGVACTAGTPHLCSTLLPVLIPLPFFHLSSVCSSLSTRLFWVAKYVYLSCGSSMFL